MFVMNQECINNDSEGSQLLFTWSDIFSWLLLLPQPSLAQCVALDLSIAKPNLRRGGDLTLAPGPNHACNRATLLTDSRSGGTHGTREGKRRHISWGLVWPEK